jgi:N-methylhydantoinase A/oxoprolinase/acetone carboxylase beta subunit
LHAGRIAHDLGMAGIIVPLYPGVYSAIGLLMSDVKHDYVQSRMTPLAELSADDANAILAQMQEQALRELRDDGFRPDQIGIERFLDMRYAGQGYEITLPCPRSRCLARQARSRPMASLNYVKPSTNFIAPNSVIQRRRSRSRLCPIVFAARVWCRRSSCRDLHAQVQHSPMHCMRHAK